MKSNATNVDEYLNELPEDRKDDISYVRNVILENLPKGYVEQMQYGMISYIIPLSEFGNTYNKQPLSYISLASQKNYMTLYLNNVYSDPEMYSWFVNEYKSSGKKLDMGKSCVRFKKLENLPLDLISEVVGKTSVDKFIKIYKHLKNL